MRRAGETSRRKVESGAENTQQGCSHSSDRDKEQVREEDVKAKKSESEVREELACR